MTRRILVAGIGNIFLGDDGFGVEVVHRLGGERLPDGVVVADFGIRGVHLAYELAGGGYNGVILVDAAPRGGAPGTLYAIEVDAEATVGSTGDADAHSLTPAHVLAWLRRIGGECGRVVIVGCEPASIDETMGLSEPVAGSIDVAMQMVRALAAEMAREPETLPCV
jgi:hydrogenase maturation protease